MVTLCLLLKSLNEGVLIVVDHLVLLIDNEVGASG